MLLTVDDTKRPACTHSCGFTLVSELVVTTTDETGTYPAAWMCNKGCGYFLNFNPKKYPDRPAFRTTPSPEHVKSSGELQRAT